MAVKYTKPKGTLDVLPAESWKWLAVENIIREVAALFGYFEIRLPTFESTEVFSRGVGEGTDIVAKEMYTFLDKGGRSVTLRPEGTAGVVRAVLENGLLASSPLPLKSYYLQSCFRYENSQKGRYREFHQFGIECFGTHEAAADVEVIALAAQLLRRLGLLPKVTLQLNSMGCPTCRPAYHAKLREYFEAHKKALCPTCNGRLAANPARILDCKEEKCEAVTRDAPAIPHFLCGGCAAHFDEVKSLLNEAGMAFEVNPRIVRGLDYYTNTVFEFTAAGIGAQGTVCGGGRYNGLIEELGGAPAPAVGFGLGMERLLMLLEENEKLPAPPPGPAIYLVGAGQAGRKAARKLAGILRNEKIPVETDLAERSIKAQMKAAGRLAVRYTMVLGDDEAQSGIAKLKRMYDGAEAELPLVGVPSAFKYVLSQDPQAQSGEDLELLVQSAGPSVSFGPEMEDED
jgi:histidyl-tRNA synthetase